MATNAAGAAASVEHFVPLLSKAENPRVVFMSSGAGSLKLASEFGFVKEYPAYSVSKAAENMVMLYYHHRFPDWKVNASNPGFRVSLSYFFFCAFVVSVLVLGMLMRAGLCLDRLLRSITMARVSMRRPGRSLRGPAMLSGSRCLGRTASRVLIL